MALLIAVGLAMATPVLAGNLHTSSGTGSTKWGGNWGTTAPGSKYGEFTCDTCHEPNNMANAKNIRQTLYTPDGSNWPNGQPQVNVNFRNVTSLGDDTARRSASMRICEVCHSQNRFHNFSTGTRALNHPNPKDVCTTCHKHDTGFKAACGGCHGNPPRRATFGNDSGLVGNPRQSNALLPGQAGAHDKHVNGRQLVCDTCHLIDTTTAKMPNQSGTIDLGFNGFAGKVTSGTYVPFTSATRGFPFKSGTPNTIIAPGQTDPLQANICANVYCHGGGAPGKAPLSGGSNQTPRWDGAAQSACGSCHAATASAPPQFGSHRIHAGSNANNGYGYSCDFCHPATDISHVQGNVRWKFSATESRVAGATYQPDGSPTAANEGSTGNLAPSSQYGTCANLYCHYANTPRWGASLATDCTGCHGNDEYSASPMTKNAHKAHVFNRSTRFNHFDFKCQECHANTVDSTGRAISNRSAHANGTKTIAWSPLATRTSGTVAFDGTGAACATTYCHSNGRNGAPNVTPVNWTAVADGSEGNYGCNSCHGGLTGQPNPMATDRHANHITTSPVGAILHKGIACDKCHDMTIGTNGQSINHDSGLHINKSYDVTFAKFANRSGVYDQGNNRTCRSTYCHGRSNPRWGTTALNTCGSCHRASNTTTNGGLSTAHLKHYNSSTTPANYTNEGWTNVNKSLTSNVFMCGTCHAVDPNTQHLNGPVSGNGAAAEVAINLPFTIPAARQYPAGGVPVVTRGTTVVTDGAGYFYSRETSCAVYCHSNGRGSAPVNVMTWDTATTSCGNCHNKAGDSSPSWSGAHTKHLTSTVSTAATCNACHAATSSANNALIGGRRDRHPNGFINVTGNSVAGGVMRWNGLNCTNALCHYSQPTPNWEGGAMNPATKCISCHGGTAVSGSAMRKRGHKAHINNQSAKFAGFNFKCSECHFNVVMDNNTSIKPTGTGLHLNGTGTVNWGALSNNGGAYSAGNCASIYCHSNGGNTTTPTYRAPTNWNSIPDGQEGTAKCDYCHDGTGQNGETKIGTGRHTKHVNSSGDAGINHKVLTCDTCHKLTTDANYNILIANGTHINRAKDVRIKTFANRSGLYTGGSCQTTYCHGRNNPNWAATTVNCGSCHAASNTLGFGLSSTHRKHYNSGTAVTNNNGWNVTKGASTTAYVFQCGVCHNVTPSTNHVNGPVQANGAAAEVVISLPFSVPTGAAITNSVTYGSGQRQDGAGYIFSSGTTCSTYCHSNAIGGAPNTPMYWGATTTSCGNCHNSTNDGRANSWSAPHTKHIRAYAEGGNSNFNCATCHRRTTTNGTTIADFNRHVNGYRNVSTSAWAGGTWNGAVCATVYCHSDGKATPVYVTNQGWTTVAANCLGCHGGAISNGGNNSPLSGRHAKHVNSATNALKCASCHYKTVSATDNLALKNFSGVRYHVNKTRDVTLNATYGGSWNGTACLNTYCHSNGTNTVTIPANTSLAWSNGTSTCSSCHGFPPSYTSGKLNSHIQHVTNGGYSCDYCHVKTTVTGSTIAGNGRHADRFYNVSGNTAKLTVANFAYNASNNTCSTSQCHTSSMPWGTNTTAHTCTKCHGTLTTATSVTNAQMAPNTGAHQAHVSGAGTQNLSKTLTCWECHQSGATANFTNHMNGAKDVTFANASTARDNATTTNWGGSASPTCTVYCHGAKMPYGDTMGTGRTPAWTNSSYLSATAGTAPTAADCGLCHGNPPSTGTSSRTADHLGKAPTVSCNECHSHVNTNGTFNNKALHIDGVIEASGSCVDCHAKVQTGTHGTPRDAVKGEFGLAWGHKKSGRAAVTDADCIVCHLEGDFATQKPATNGKHKDGNIDLRDPDGAGEVAITDLNNATWTFTKFAISFAAGSRTTSAANNIPNIITQKFCLKCHDSNGATNTTARSNNGGTGTAFMPFGGLNLGSGYTLLNGAAAVGGVANVAASFATTNSSAHPVLGPRSKSYPTPARLVAPYNGFTRTGGTKSNSVVMNCFDCHNETLTIASRVTNRTITAHGGTLTIPGTLYDPAVGGVSVVSPTFCINCHAGYNTTTGHGTGSAVSTTASTGNMSASRFATCANCHFSAGNKPARPLQATDVHGFNGLAATGNAWTYGNANGMRPIALLRNVQRWPSTSPRPTSAPGITTGQANCGGSMSSTAGGVSCSNTMSNYSPGGAY